MIGFFVGFAGAAAVAAFLFVRWPEIKAKVAEWVKSFNNVG